MYQNKFITFSLMVVLAAGCVLPAYADVQTVYVPSSAGQTVIYQQSPAQTIVVQEPVQQTVYVQRRVPSETLLTVGVGTLIGGLILHSIWDRNHHHSFRPAPPKSHFGGYKSSRPHRR